MADLIVGPGTPLYAELDALAREARLVCLAGLPGTGKSLMIHQLAHLAHALGRSVYLLQWDVIRPPFEASPAGQPYPQQQGVTHALIRIAAGRWARCAVARWHADHPGAEHLLIGETPLVGHRLIELARIASDPAEPLLAGDSARFVIPVPSSAVRRHLETERERRDLNPQHDREREDAPPDVLRALWRELVDVAGVLGLTEGMPPAGSAVSYDPVLYGRVYEHVLRRRHTQVLPLDVILPAANVSAYRLAMPRSELMPAPAEIAEFIRSAEADYADPQRLDREIARWYET